jgi:hypothetical protein
MALSLNAILEKATGSPRYVGTISVTTVVATQAVASEGVYMLCPDTDDICIAASTASAGTVTKSDGSTATLTAAIGVPIDNNEKFFLTTRSGETYIAAILASGSGNLKIFQMF